MARIRCSASPARTARGLNVKRDTAKSATRMESLFVLYIARCIPCWIPDLRAAHDTSLRTRTSDGQQRAPFRIPLVWGLFLARVPWVNRWSNAFLRLGRREHRATASMAPWARLSNSSLSGGDRAARWLSADVHTEGNRGRGGLRQEPRVPRCSMRCLAGVVVPLGCSLGTR